jgi:hypothetical protein
MKSILFPRFWGLVSPLLIFVLVLSVAVASAQTPNITRVEEDWELVVAQPTPSSDAPQLRTLIAPVGNLDSLYATFLINHRNSPAFEGGGLELQVWNGREKTAHVFHPNQTRLSTPGETIRWTQAMSLGGEGLVFEILAGTSVTWGNFSEPADQNPLKITVPTTLTNLNGFDPAVSVDHSDISYAANRVQSLALKRIRTYAGSQLIAEDNNPRVLHSLSE